MDIRRQFTIEEDTLIEGGGTLESPIKMSNLDGMDVGVCDAPKSVEILLAPAMTTGGRPHPRILGGVTKAESD